jgi:hypothetical protein
LLQRVQIAETREKDNLEIALDKDRQLLEQVNNLPRGSFD